MFDESNLNEFKLNFNFKNLYIFIIGLKKIYLYLQFSISLVFYYIHFKNE